MTQISLVRMQSGLRVFDWALAGGSFGYGVYSGNPWWIGSGLIGFGLAWYNPAVKINEHIRRKFVARAGQDRKKGAG